MPKHLVSHWLIKAACFLALVTSIAVAGPQFLTLPFANPNVVLKQGWFYDSPGPFICTDLPVTLTNRCHKGVDYFCVESNSIKSFEVLAAAPGKAIATYTEKGYGYFVYVVHEQFDEFGRRVFTLHAHLEEDSWGTVPFKDLGRVREDISNGDFADWKPVGRGEKLAMTGKTGFAAQIHLHFEVQLTGYGVSKADPYNIYGTRDYYSFPCHPSPLLPIETTSTFPSSMWTECPPVSATTTVVLQPGPTTGKDIWTTSVYSYAPGGSFPGGGLNNDILRIGGWGDQYYALLQFNLTGLPANASSAVLHLYCSSQSGGGTTMYLDRIAQAWDWRTQGTGRDRERLWWVDRPLAVQWRASAISNPAQGQWYMVDITDLYNAWQSGTYPNNGLQFRPVSFFNNNFNEFFSADYLGDPSLRPKIVIGQ